MRKSIKYLGIISVALFAVSPLIPADLQLSVDTVDASAKIDNDSTFIKLIKSKPYFVVQPGQDIADFENSIGLNDDDDKDQSINDITPSVGKVDLTEGVSYGRYYLARNGEMYEYDEDAFKAGRTYVLIPNFTITDLKPGAKYTLYSNGSDGIYDNEKADEDGQLNAEFCIPIYVGQAPSNTSTSGLIPGKDFSFDANKGSSSAKSNITSGVKKTKKVGLKKVQTKQFKTKLYSAKGMVKKVLHGRKILKINGKKKIKVSHKYRVAYRVKIHFSTYYILANKLKLIK